MFGTVCLGTIIKDTMDSYSMILLCLKLQVGQPSEDCENDHDGKPGSSKLAMGLKIATAGAMAGAELVESLGQPMIIISIQE